jgi:hypothetical protein
MKTRFLIVAFVTLLAISAVLGRRGRRAPPPPPTVRFVCLTNGVPGNTSLDGLGPLAAFARLNPRLVQDWFTAGTNAAAFSVSNSFDRAIFLLPEARLATAADKGGWGRHTPLLLGGGQAGVSLQPGQTGLVQVARIPHEGPFRLQLCYLLAPTDDSDLKMLFAKLKGTANRGSTGFIYSDWVNP